MSRGIQRTRHARNLARASRMNVRARSNLSRRSPPSRVSTRAALVRMPVILLVADGARYDTIDAATRAGSSAPLPALARLRAEGALHPVTTAFPSVTGVAYAPFLTG